MKMQKFHKGDSVRIAADLGSSMSHFTKDCDAIVMGSYADQFGGSSTDSYTLLIEGHGESSWYYESQLTLIESNRHDLITEWKDKIEAEKTLKSDLDWIFQHGKEILTSAHGSTVSALASCLGLDNLWGSHGEGYVYYQNARMVLSLARPFLESGDKDGWLTFAMSTKSQDNQSTSS